MSINSPASPPSRSSTIILFNDQDRIALTVLSFAEFTFIPVATDGPTLMLTDRRGMVCPDPLSSTSQVDNASAGPRHEYWNHSLNCHHSRDDMKRSAIRTCRANKLLKDRRLLRDDRNARERIQKQQQPERIPLPGLECLAERVIASCTLRSLRSSWRPTLGSPAFGRILHKQAGNNGHNQICDAQIGKGVQYANALNEPGSYRGRDQSAGSETTNRDPGDESSAIWKPFHQDRNRNDVRESQPNPTDQAVTQIQPPKFISGEAREKYSQSIEYSSGDRDHARPFTIQPEAAKESRDAQHKNAYSKGQRYFGNAPAELPDERSTEYAPCIHCAQRNLHQYPSRSNDPSIKGWHKFSFYSRSRCLIAL